MSEFENLRQQIRENGATYGIYAAAILLSITLFGLSLHWDSEKYKLMGSLQDCSWVHTIPGPDNCADSLLMSDYDDLGNRSKVAFAGSIVLVIALTFVPLLRNSREQ